MNISITIDGDLQFSADLQDTETARTIYEALPLEGKGNTWGEEVYFLTSVQIKLEQNARDTLEPGELGYWPDMQAFCIFYGPTPASQGNEIKAAGPINVFGMINEDLNPLKDVSGPVNVVVEKGR